jgi:hypothetical protein
MRKLHATARPWLCRECSSAFTEKTEYEAHAREHSTKGERAECDICNYAHRSKDVVVRQTAFDHLEDGSHASKCTLCKYQNASFCGLSTHAQFAHPDSQVPAPKPTGLPTPSPSPPFRTSTSSPPGNEGNVRYEAADAFLRNQGAVFDGISQLERDTMNLPSRERKRKEKAAAKKAGCGPASGSS